MLAPLFRFSGINPGPYKLLIVSILLLCILAIALFYRDKIPPAYLILLLILFGFNPYITDLKNDILSDIPFLLFLYVALLFFGDAREPDAKWSSYLPRAIFAGFFSYLAYGTRSIGLGVIVSAIALSLLRYHKLTRFVLVAALTFGIFAGIQSSLVSANSDYLRLVTFKWHVLIQNLRFYAGTTSYLWDGGVGSIARLVVFAVATALALIGGLRQIRRSLDLVTIFSIGYGVVLILLPFGQARYILPIIPFYLYLLVCGLQAANRFVGSQSQIAATVTLAVMGGVLGFTYVGRFATTDFGPSPDAWDSPSARRLYALVQASTPKDAVIIASAPRALVLYTGRRAAQFPWTASNAESLATYIAKIGATYLLVNRTDSNQWVSQCGHACAAEPVFSIPTYVLYKTSPLAGKRGSSD
jgi:hypothetical protein